MRKQLPETLYFAVIDETEHFRKTSKKHVHPVDPEETPKKKSKSKK